METFFLLAATFSPCSKPCGLYCQFPQTLEGDSDSPERGVNKKALEFFSIFFISGWLGTVRELSAS